MERGSRPVGYRGAVTHRSPGLQGRYPGRSACAGCDPRARIHEHGERTGIEAIAGPDRFRLVTTASAPLHGESMRTLTDFVVRPGADPAATNENDMHTSIIQSR